MKFIVGSKSIRKINIVKKVAEEILKKDIEVTGLEADSKVPYTPYNKQTHDGAQNRAIFCKNSNTHADYFVGLESGLVNRYGHVYEEAWAAVLDKNGNKYFGYSSGLKVPDLILNKMRENKIEHHDVMNLLDHDKTIKIKHETWGNYTSGLLLRETSLAEALRNALLQIFAPDGNWYK